MTKDQIIFSAHEMYLSGVVHYNWQQTKSNPEQAEEAGEEAPVSFEVAQELQGINH